jgi:hypothetical protein
MPMTSEAHRALSETIRRLRTSLVDHLHGAVDSQWRLSLPADELPPPARRARGRFEALVAERARVRRDPAGARADLEKLAAATWLNRLVFLRIFEATAQQRTGNQVLTGYKRSHAYREFLDYAGPLGQDATFGYATLLRVVFDELAVDLPGLFGDGIADLLPMPPAALSELCEALGDPALDSCWTDDTTPGWVYQYWNDPDREALDAKIAAGQKVEPHEVASKTQMFTERYMVEWLLHNSLGALWLAICRQNGWLPDVLREGTLEELERRRAEFREQRARGEIPPDTLVPLQTELERRWAYYVPHERGPDNGDESVPDSIRGVRILDPACGSGHFLVIAFDLLMALYEEEARHRGVRWTRREIAAWILEDNLHGVDLDVRAVQIAAAALWTKARQVAPDAAPRRIQLVAADLGLQSLRADDPKRLRFTEQLKTDTSMPQALIDAVWKAMAEVDFLGSLLRVEKTLQDAILDADTDFFQPTAKQGTMLSSRGVVGEEERFGRTRISFAQALARVQKRVKQFLSAHTGSDDLGLRLSGEQLAAGLRFLELVREGSYHLVVGNPPYQGTSRLADPRYVQKQYPMGKADLYAAFLERALELCVPGGTSALLTMRNWMFLSQYESLRRWILAEHDVRVLGDFATGAFDDVPNDVLSVVGSVIRRGPSSSSPGVAIQPSPPSVPEYDRERTRRKRAAVLAQVGRCSFRVSAFDAIPGSPVLYWWPAGFFEEYKQLPRFGDVYVARTGMSTQDNTRFVRLPHEVGPGQVGPGDWAPYVKGGAGREWLEPVSAVVAWRSCGLAMKTQHEHAFRSTSKYIMSESRYFQTGVAFCTTGATFSARLPTAASIFSNVASTVFAEGDNDKVLCILNSTRARRLLADLNPTIHFELGDVARLPVFPVESAPEIVARLREAFETHEAHREPSVLFRSPGPSPWEYAQQWAQRAVDRPPGAPLPPYEPTLVPEAPTEAVSYALGAVLGRFAAAPSGDGTSVLDPARADLSHALPDGVLFLDGALDGQDDLELPLAQPLREAWRQHGSAIDGSNDVRGLRTWLRTTFFGLHRKTYEQRPIHWPLSSSQRTFVAWVNLHRMGPHTLTAVLARAEACYRDLKARAVQLRGDRDGTDARASKRAEKALGSVQKQLAELEAFVEDLRATAYKGPPQPSPAVPAREVDAAYAPVLDDGVMINAAALWPLLDPQWKDPRKWWTELARADGRKDYDWSHLARRYWPARVDSKCKEDPSLAVVHGCMWRYHPERAYAWELRMQEELDEGFQIAEPDAHKLRLSFVEDHPDLVRELHERESKRRARKHQPEEPAMFKQAEEAS